MDLVVHGSPADNAAEMTEATLTQPPVTGREVQLARVASFLSGVSPVRGLALVGEPGIGKTTVWEAGLVAARASGMRVLAARPSEPELQHSFLALADLLD